MYSYAMYILNMGLWFYSQLEEAWCKISKKPIFQIFHSFIPIINY